VVILTDGADNSIPTRILNINGQKLLQFVESARDRDFQKMLRTAGERQIPFYFVAVGTDRNPSFNIPPEFFDVEMANLRELRSRMEQLAEVSGGGIVFPVTPEDVIPM
jgi:hypothetical protein